MSARPEERAAWRARERAGQHPIFCDLFLRPSRARLEPSWLHWCDGVIVKAARAIHAGRRFGELPILADALEDAGCDRVEVLAHARGPGPHMRGCWLIEAILAAG